MTGAQDSEIILPRLLRDNPWIDYRHADSDVLLVTFSSIATAKGKFTPYLAVNDLPWSILRVNTPDALWYVGGIPETDAYVGLFEALLSELIANGKFRRVYFFGGSKGGFGAIEFGLRVKSDVIIATGTETVFGHPSGYAIHHVPTPRIERARKRMEDWSTLMLERDRRVHILYGWESEVDRIFAAEARRLLGVKPIVLRGCGHSVPQFIAEKAKFNSVIFELAESGESRFINEHVM